MYKLFLLVGLISLNASAVGTKLMSEVHGTQGESSLPVKVVECGYPGYALLMSDETYRVTSNKFVLEDRQIHFAILNPLGHVLETKKTVEAGIFAFTATDFEFQGVGGLNMPVDVSLQIDSRTTTLGQPAIISLNILRRGTNTPLKLRYLPPCEMLPPHE